MAKKIIPAKDVLHKHAELSEQELLQILSRLLPKLNHPDMPGRWIQFQHKGRRYNGAAPFVLLQLTRALVEKRKAAKRGKKPRRGDKTAIATAALVLRRCYDYKTQKAADQKVAEITKLSRETITDYRKEKNDDAQQHARQLVSSPDTWELPGDPTEAVQHILLIVDGKQMTLAITAQ